MAPRARKSMGERIDTPEATKPTTASDPFTAAVATPTGGGAGAGTIPLALIDADPENLRADVGEVTELAQSIRELGILQPVLLRRTPDGRYAVVAGHRRRAGAEAAGLTEIPAVVQGDMSDTGRDLAMLVENLQREDLTALEEARGYERVLARKDVGGQSGLAKKIGRSQGHISKRLALLKLPADALARIDAGKLPVTDAAELVALAAWPDRIAHILTAVERDDYRSIKSEARRHLREVEEETRIAAELDKLRAAGVPEVGADVENNMGHGPWPVSWLGGITEEEHAGLPCHAWRYFRGRLSLLCTDPASHEDEDPEDGTEVDGSGGEAVVPERVLRQRREDAERQAAQAAREAERVRQAANAERRLAFAAELVAKSNDYAPGFSARMWLLSTFSEAQPTPALVAQVLGHEDPAGGADEDTTTAVDALFTARSARYAQRVLYAIALAAGDASTSGYLDSDESVAVARLYLDHLTGAGFALSEDDQTTLDAITDYEKERDANA
jgi:ParB family chromosome partitioning protein